jgi:hypothetical protein
MSVISFSRLVDMQLTFVQIKKRWNIYARHVRRLQCTHPISNSDYRLLKSLLLHLECLFPNLVQLSISGAWLRLYSEIISTNSTIPVKLKLIIM